MKKGFTLLEVMIAISILTVGIGGSYILISQTLIMASESQNRLIASYLAQEGIELVKNIRDSNWLKMHKGGEGVTSWSEGIGISYPDPDCGLVDCKIDYKGTALESCNGDCFLYLKQDGNEFYYCHDNSGEKTKFERKVKISLESSNKIKVEVIVEWKERGGITKDFKVVNYLYPWWLESI